MLITCTVFMQQINVVFCLFSGELHRISVCYGSGKGDDDTYTFSDDQSSCQVLHSLYSLDLMDLIC